MYKIDRRDRIGRRDDVTWRIGDTPHTLTHFLSVFGITCLSVSRVVLLYWCTGVSCVTLSDLREFSLIDLLECVLCWLPWVCLAFWVWGYVTYTHTRTHTHGEHWLSLGRRSTLQRSSLSHIRCHVTSLLSSSCSWYTIKLFERYWLIYYWALGLDYSDKVYW